MGIFLGLLLDGIPESLVIGMGMIGKPTISGALIFGLCLSNLPEAMSSAVGMKAQGTPPGAHPDHVDPTMFLIGAGAFLGRAIFMTGRDAWHAPCHPAVQHP
jgi:hypothetical protein